MMQCSQRASTPILLPDRSQASTPPSAGCPVPPFPGGLDTVASRHGSRPIGKKTLGAVSVSFFVAGGFLFGRSPPWGAENRLGLSAKTLLPPPQLPASWPGRGGQILCPPAALSSR